MHVICDSCNETYINHVLDSNAITEPLNDSKIQRRLIDLTERSFTSEIIEPLHSKPRIQSQEIITLTNRSTT